MIDRPSWLPEHEWPFRSNSFETDGNVVHYTDEGDGPVVLLVHAGLWSFVWRDVMLRLRTSFRCVSLDFPGQGLSVAGDGYTTSIDACTDVLGSLVDRLGLTDVTVVAHDLGGPVAFGWAAAHPELVRALVAVNTFGWTPDSRAFRGMLRVMGSGPMRGFDSATNLLFRLTSTRLGVGRHLDAPGRRAFRGPFLARGPRRAFHDLLHDAATNRHRFSALEEGLGSALASRPLLTIFGERNDPLKFQPRWKQLFPHVRQVVVPKGLHFPMCDDPDLFATSFQEWYATVVAPGRLATP
jgi:pimeloyl-ACP methyl ester carboxylesterase